MPARQKEAIVMMMMMMMMMMMTMITDDDDNDVASRQAEPPAPSSAVVVVGMPARPKEAPTHNPQHALPAPITQDAKLVKALAAAEVR
jgi:hypothetical protein